MCLMCLAELCSGGSCKTMLLGVRVWQMEKTSNVFYPLLQILKVQSSQHSQPSAVFLKLIVRLDHAKQNQLRVEHLNSLGVSATHLGQNN